MKKYEIQMKIVNWLEEINRKNKFRFRVWRKRLEAKMGIGLYS